MLGKRNIVKLERVL